MLRTLVITVVVLMNGLAVAAMSSSVGIGKNAIDILAVGLAIIGLVISVMRLKGGTLKSTQVIAILAAAAFVGVAISNVRNHAAETQTLKYLIFLIVLPHVASLYKCWEDRTEGVSIGFLLSGIALPIVLLVAMAGGFRDVDAEGNKYVLGLHKNASSELLLLYSLAALWAAKGKKLKWGIAAVLLSGVAIIMIGGRSALLILLPAATISLLIMIEGKSKRLLLLAAILVMAVVVVGLNRSSIPILARFDELNSLRDYRTNPNSASSRLLLWEIAIDFYRHNPVWGIGYGQFRVEGESNWVVGRTEPHNGLLQVLCCGGTVGFSLFGGLLAAGFLLGRRSRWCVPCISYLISSLVGIIWLSGSGHIFWILFYMLSSESNSNINTE